MHLAPLSENTHSTSARGLFREGGGKKKKQPSVSVKKKKNGKDGM